MRERQRQGWSPAARGARACSSLRSAGFSGIGGGLKKLKNESHGSVRDTATAGALPFSFLSCTFFLTTCTVVSLPAAQAMGEPSKREGISSSMFSMK